MTSETTTLVSIDTIRAAAARISRAFQPVVCDARRLAFRSASVDLIVSPSTLDHFEAGIDLAESLDELTYRVRFDKTRVSTSELIRKILNAGEVRDLLIEDEPIEEIIKRIYAGEELAETPSGAHRLP